MKAALENILQQMAKDSQRKKAIFKAINRIRKKDLDNVFHEAHEAVFDKVDCLDCANCCKTTSPIFRDADIKRLAKHLRMKPVAFIDQYLKLDDEQDYVLKSSPCAFLNDDNTCQVYENRPLACKGYPHTDRKNMYQILQLTRKNTEICPAVCSIVEKITDI